MTIRIGIAGVRGRMGRELATLIASDPELTLAGGVSRQSGNDEPNVVADPGDLVGITDVLIDFTNPEGAIAQATACARSGTPLVTGTTGLNADQTSVLRAASRNAAVFQAANMSPGINAILAILPALTQALAGYDVEIVETHHRHKIDAPSGTALVLARGIASGDDDLAARASFGRHGAVPRTSGEIGIHAVRGGGNPGEHLVLLTGEGEEVRLSHRAFNRAAYALGALRAAKLLVGQPAGWYEPATLPGFL